MAIQWTDALAVGIDDVDAQHKELFRQADRLLEASQKGLRAIDKEGASLALLFQVQKRIVEWLNNHIRKEDKALGAYLKTKLVASGR